MRELWNQNNEMGDNSRDCAYRPWILRRILEKGKEKSATHERLYGTKRPTPQPEQ